MRLRVLAKEWRHSVVVETLRGGEMVDTTPVGILVEDALVVATVLYIALDRRVELEGRREVVPLEHTRGGGSFARRRCCVP